MMTFLGIWDPRYVRRLTTFKHVVLSRMSTLYRLRILPNQNEHVARNQGPPHLSRGPYKQSTRAVAQFNRKEEGREPLGRELHHRITNVTQHARGNLSMNLTLATPLHPTRMIALIHRMMHRTRTAEQAKPKGSVKERKNKKGARMKLLSGHGERNLPMTVMTRSYDNQVSSNLQNLHRGMILERGMISFSHLVWATRESTASFLNSMAT